MSVLEVGAALADEPADLLLLHGHALHHELAQLARRLHARLGRLGRGLGLGLRVGLGLGVRGWG